MSLFLQMWQTKEEGNLRCPLCRVQLNPELDLTTFTASDKKIVRLVHEIIMKIFMKFSVNS
jgi:hypothetical protein